MKKISLLLTFFMLVTLIGCTKPDTAETQKSEMKMTTAIPASITTPDTVKTRLGTLKYFDGYPDPDTVEIVYDHLFFMRGVQAFLNAIPAASLVGVRDGFRDVGAVDGTVGIFETLMDSKSLFLTPNTESVYAMTWLDLKNGPIVVESPPNVLGIVDDFWFRYVADMGNAGPDKGQGGKFVFLPPDYKGDVPDGYFAYKSATYGNICLWRGFLVNGDAGPAAKSFKQHIRIYPLDKKNNPPKQEFVNLSGREFNTIHANNFEFFEEVNQVVQEEPVGSGDPETLGLLASIGIEKGKRFAPDADMKKILVDAAAVGNATARAIVFDGRDSAAYIYKNSAWKTGFIGGSHEFLVNDARLLDPRTMFFYYATMITPAMSMKMVGVGAQYGGAAVDANGDMLDGSKTYKLTFPPDVPAKDFWSLVVYDNQTRSMLQTDQQFPSLNSERGVQQNTDGSTDIYFGPAAPEGKESNWIQTVPGKGWTVILRLYGPLDPWFDQTWKPGEIEPINDIQAVKPTGVKMKMATELPAKLLTPDKVETRIGTLEFVDGFPTKKTVQLVYDNLDFIRGVEAFLNAIPGASLVAARQGASDVGITRNGIVGITESLMDSKSLFLTPNTESIYAITWLDLKDGPMVVESAPNTLGMVNDFFFRYVADLGNAGPDKGKGGKYLFLPPGYEGETPDGYFTYKSPTYGNVLFWRAFLVNGDPKSGVASLKKHTRIYPLARPQDRDKISFINTSGLVYNTIHANDFTFYEEVNTLIQEEPAEAFNPELLGLLASVGIEKGKPFNPDARMQKILIDAVAVGNATARAITFHQEGNEIASEGFLYEDTAWFIPFVGGNHEFIRNGARLLDARTMFHYPATAITPAMAIKMVGVGSQYGIAAMDADKKYLDGSKDYKLTLPKDIPAKDFWSLVVYDPQTRSLLQTDQRFPSLNSERNQVVANADGSTDINFGPEAPAGKEENWIQTVPGKGWFLILRLYGPLESWFDQTWKPGEIELVK